MKTRIVGTFLLLSAFATLAQQSSDPKWTDKNNRQMSAEYMLRLSYYDQGYMGVQVRVSKAAGRDVFAVEPGPIYHIKEVVARSLSDAQSATLMRDAPKAGDVYSAARMNEWMKSLRDREEHEGLALRVPQWGVEFDHEHAGARVFVSF
jgi:outer membrane protein assembly factor BamA